MEKLHKALEKEIARQNLVIDKFHASFRAAPAYAFGWSQSAFEAAAKVAVYTQIKEAIEGKKATEAHILEHARRELEQGAANPKFSTSTTSNLIEQYKTSAWAAFLEIARWELV